MKIVKIRKKAIGAGFPVYVIAEIGGNFSSYEAGVKLINSAIEAGADAVKIQTFTAKNTVSKYATLDMPVVHGKKNQLQVLRSLELDRKIQKKLFDYCKRKNITIFSSPSHRSDVDFLEENNVCAYKLGSDDFTNHPLIKYVAELKKPTILSTGMSSMKEVREAIKTFYATGNNELILLHCVSMYPFEPKFANLRAIQSMQKLFNIPIGWSDHTNGIDICIAAATLGANVIEKHYMLSKKTAGPDHMLSANPKQLSDMIKTIRTIEQAKGDGVKKPAACEKPIIKDVRKSIVAARPIPKGAKITIDMLEIKRPGIGIPPKFLSRILRKRVVRNIKADETIRFADIK
ncbi:MAG: N-acetylneuraminate synthase family protein [Candidatus Nitrosotenuis sp.]